MKTDDAQQTVYFDNTVIDPVCDYTYDVIYRLIKAIGRENASNTAAVVTMILPTWEWRCPTRAVQ